ncbi:MAG: cytidylate kinase-like family protein [Lachnospira sp.]|nr:cytidylate kinase-like family protein [Lachnospira sp.]MDD5829523.1 cytidylate kinase-like family protein [Lachnospira sp.]
MDERTVITIGREFGSGGHEIGSKLAERLGIKCYDKELLELAAKQSGLCEELFASQDEKPTNSFLYSLVMDTYSLGYTNSYVDMPINHKVFLAQFDAIKKLAEKESCVIVGRCADYALEDDPFAVSVFIKAGMDDRIKRIKRIYELNDSKAADLIQKTDKRRASYYNYYSSKKWGEAKSYDLCIDSGVVGIDGAIDMILKFIELKEANMNKEA